MKDQLVRVARTYVPKSLIGKLEEVYRRGRIYAVSAQYGFPARGLRVIAVTGTNGKTTTANYLNEIMKASGKKTALFTTAVIEIAGERTLNELNATVASTARMQEFFRDAKNAGVDAVILEITSHSLIQHKLDGVPIECAVMTNLTQDHLDYHKTMEEYARAKGMLFAKNPRFIVLNRDDQWFEFYNQFEAGEQKMTYGTNEGADARISQVKLYKKGSEARLVIDHQTKLEMATALPGKYNVYNMVAAATAAYMFHANLDAITEGVANLESIPGRFERVETGTNFEVVVDYAHTPDALEQLLETTKSITKNRVILVFGACGDRDKGKRPIMGEIAARLADRIVLTDEESYGEDPATIRAMVMEGIAAGGGEAKTEEIADRREAIDKALKIARKDDTILITGMGHENFRIVNGERLPWNDANVVRELTQK
ncbi:MAG: UDP-N-acetylmuramoyl-L-alanyl-D-glutamate--2,6-diaminopimelate ligase [Candidatus Saccharimonadales bacterium]